MTERDWESVAVKRVERLVADIVSRIRDTADRIEREARYNVANACEKDRDLDFHTYHWVASQVFHEIQTMFMNLAMGSLIDAAGDAETARTTSQHANGRGEKTER